MPLSLIAILAFVLGAVIFAVLQRNNYLEKLPLEAGERILFEDAKAKFEAKGGAGRWQRYPWGFIRVTNQRIIFSQGGFLEKKHVLRFIVAYAGPHLQDRDLSAGEILKSGRQQLPSDLKHMEWGEKKGKTALKIFPSKDAVAWYEISEIVLYPGKPEDYFQCLLPKST